MWMRHQWTDLRRSAASISGAGLILDEAACKNASLCHLKVQSTDTVPDHISFHFLVFLGVCEMPKAV